MTNKREEVNLSDLHGEIPRLTERSSLDDIEMHKILTDVCGKCSLNRCIRMGNVRSVSNILDRYGLEYDISDNGTNYMLTLTFED